MNFHVDKSNFPVLLEKKTEIRVKANRYQTKTNRAEDFLLSIKNHAKRKNNKGGGWWLVVGL
jgi:hypothetical protein